MFKFNCWSCKQSFGGSGFNVARIAVRCPYCNATNKLDESLGRVYGHSVREAIAPILKATEEMCKHVKGDLSAPLALAYWRIEEIVKGARA